jgi:hypothetical protein
LIGLDLSIRPEHPLTTAAGGLESTKELQDIWNERTRLQLQKFVRFCQEKGLLAESVLPANEQMPLGFELRLKDITEAVLYLARGGPYYDWIPNWPWPDDPVKNQKLLANTKVLERGLAKFYELQVAAIEEAKHAPEGGAPVPQKKFLLHEDTIDVPYDKFEDASWHSEGDFPEDLDADAAATHGGMYVAWLTLLGLVSKSRQADFPQTKEDLMNRVITPGQCFLRDFDGKLTTEDLGSGAIGFTKHYYLPAKRGFHSDYMKALGLNDDNFYTAPDSWETFEKLGAVFSKRFNAWVKKQMTKS